MDAFFFLGQLATTLTDKCRSYFLHKMHFINFAFHLLPQLFREVRIMKILNHPNIGKSRRSLVCFPELCVSAEMFRNVSHGADGSGGLYNPLRRNSLFFSQRRRSASIHPSRRLLPSAQKHSCASLCVPLLSIYHLTGPHTALLPPSFMMSSGWPLGHPEAFGSAVWDASKCLFVETLVLVRNADRSIRRLFFRLFCIGSN